MLAVLVLLAGCRVGGDGGAADGAGELETVEVGEAQDAGIDLSGDAVGRRSVESVSGILPGDFPTDLPVYKPSSVVDFGVAENGVRFVLFASSDPPAKVRSRLESGLAAQGWEVLASGATAISAAKHGRSARIAIRDVGGSAEIRVEYRLI